ncbi:2,3-diaminopropionate biosynthesis protein SbnB [Streptomyces sp. NPDC058092]|uniref:2,3-diaminopropionate biosynthesis protein SbnB n=1 Tax=Streptomyces sp. NPDC058092 TaxID=3346336 RepID=UPI0036E3E4E9
MTTFSVLTGTVITELLAGQERVVIDRVREAYLAHDEDDSVNPDSYFLRFPAKPDSRIIALPAYLGGDVNTAGIKWISSFPANVTKGEPRASAVLILNDYATGRPFALLEGAGISAVRTAASAALAATALTTAQPATVGVVGGGVIARTICQYLYAAGVAPAEIRCHDIDPMSAAALTSHLRERYAVTAQETELLAALDCDLVLFATTALSPYVPSEFRFRAGQLVLNISLRDLAPQTLLAADNVFDDVEHCMKANTSPHLAEQLTRGRAFVTGTLAGVLRGRVSLAPDRPTVFSPFGLGILDLAVGHWLYERAVLDDRLVRLPDFFGESRRW